MSKTTFKKKLSSKIKYMPYGNRAVDMSHVNTLKRSILQYGLLRSVVTFKTKIFSGEGKIEEFIGDGQHMIKAAEMLGKAHELTVIQYTKPLETIKEIILFVASLNTTSKKWNLSDFVNIWKYENIDYEKLVKYKVAYPSLYYSHLAIALNPSNNHKTSIGNIIKSGDFKIAKKTHGDAILGYLHDIKVRMPNLVFYNFNSFCKVFSRLYKSTTYNHNKFCKHLEINKDKLASCNNVVELESFIKGNKFRKISNRSTKKVAAKR